MGIAGVFAPLLVGSFWASRMGQITYVIEVPRKADLRFLDTELLIGTP
jgi:hypothetical protein